VLELIALGLDDLDFDLEVGVGAEESFSYELTLA
jgi:hypothetical protein